MEINCKQCGKKKYWQLNVIKRGSGKYCSIECYNISKKGKSPCNNQGLTFNCLICGKKKQISPSRLRNGRGRFCSQKCSDIWKKNRPNFRIKGERNGCWRGGINSLQLGIRSSLEYRLWRTTVFERDQWICQDCGSYSGALQADHIKPFALILHENNIQTLEQALACEELFDLSNGRTLCLNCHKKTPTYLAPLSKQIALFQTTL